MKKEKLLQIREVGGNPHGFKLVIILGEAESLRKEANLSLRQQAVETIQYGIGVPIIWFTNDQIPPDISTTRKIISIEITNMKRLSNLKLNKKNAIRIYSKTKSFNKKNLLTNKKVGKQIDNALKCLLKSNPCYSQQIMAHVIHQDR